MTPQDIRVRLDATATIPEFDRATIHGVLAAIDGNEQETRRWLALAEEMAEGTRWIAKQVEQAISGNRDARITIWVFGRAAMSSNGHTLLIAALLLQAGPPQ